MRGSSALTGVQRVLLRPGLGLFVQPFHVGLELPSIDPPDAAAPDLDRGEITRTDERVDLGDAHAEIRRHVVEGEKAGLYRRALRGAVLLRHRVKLPPDCDRFIYLNAFAYVCARESATGAGS